MHGKVATILCVVVVLGGVLISSAAADEGNKAVSFSVSTPTEVPGRVLKPGRYELKLQGVGSSVAGLWNAAGSRFYGYFPTVLVDRSRAPENAEIVFTRSGTNAPLMLEEWFYPGHKTGNELLYSTPSKVQVAGTRSTQQQVNR